MHTIKLSNDIEMPAIIMSTNWMDYPTMKKVVTAGLQTGYRAFDTARDYGNEHIVGKVLKECLEEQGLKREDIFITTKIGNSQQRVGNIDEQIDISLKNLKTDYVDCWMMHWPYPNYYIETYHKMEKVYNSGKARAIGMANYHVRHFNKLLEAGIEIEPHCVQFEHHPMRTADDIVQFCNDRKITIQAYSPLCRMIEPIRNSEILHAIAKRYGKTVGQVILRWHIQHGSVPCFKSVNPERLKENFDIWDFKLTDEEMKEISSMDCDYKYHLESASCPGF
ncbi:MAG: aldo/keto reductase [Muribaculaceae bacterium]|nr:aldo/keto reductase [Muribaculaceae bacterium]